MIGSPPLAGPQTGPSDLGAGQFGSAGTSGTTTGGATGAAGFVAFHASSPVATPANSATAPAAMARTLVIPRPPQAGGTDAPAYLSASDPRDQQSFSDRCDRRK